MAEDPIGQRGKPRSLDKLFTAFKVALDMRKLLLAAAGILAMHIGWGSSLGVRQHSAPCPNSRKPKKGISLRSTETFSLTGSAGTC